MFYLVLSETECGARSTEIVEGFSPDDVYNTIYDEMAGHVFVEVLEEFDTREAAEKCIEEVY